MKISFTDFVSEAITEVVFDGDLEGAGDVYITFKSGRTYVYRVWGDTIAELTASPHSVGEWFNSRVRSCAQGVLTA